MCVKELQNTWLAVLFLSWLSACGGGAETALPNSDSQNSSNNNAAYSNLSSPGSFSLSHKKIGFTANEFLPQSFSQDITGVVDNLSEGLFLSVDVSQANVLSSAQVVLSETELTGVLTLETVYSDTLLPGTHYGTVIVNACTDASCSRHYSGSPAEIEVMYSVLPSQNPDINCSDEYGVVFRDCVDPDWLGVAAWEMSTDGNNVQLKHTDAENPDRLINWLVVDSFEQGYDLVLDVHYTQQAGNGSLRFPAAFDEDEFAPYADMRRFANGSIEFDMRVIEWADVTDITTHIECHWPCTSANVPLNISGNEWHHISIPIPGLVESGLNLLTVTTGLLIEPTWDAMQGFHYQLDNVRWLPGEGDPSGPPTEIDLVLNAAGMVGNIVGSPDAIFTHQGFDTYVTPGWNSPADQIELSYELSEAVDISDGVVASLTVQVPENYNSSETLAQMFVRDNNGLEARAIVTIALGEYAGFWVRLRYDYYEQGADPEFDPRTVTSLGVRLFHDSVNVDHGADELRFNRLALESQ